ncbi:MAG: GAF domain-containing protein [Tannerella sp.]|nr:GAF domain-containing protein [Tannerella sp.]
MTENLYIMQTGNKENKYKALVPQIAALVHAEKDPIANLANISAAIHQTFGFFWVGFYLVKENELVLAPFQGPVACTRIKHGKGVCGTAWETAETIIVSDVNKFPGHIACSTESKSEIVVPLFSGSNVTGVLDIDSDKLNDFDETDKVYLEEICKIIE